MIRNAEKQLFDGWKALSTNPEKIIADGIIDVNAWISPENKKHVLFVLRDKNGNVFEKYVEDAEYPNNFRKELAERGSGAKTWNNIARWGQALNNSDLQYEEVKYFSSGYERGTALKPFAAINCLWYAFKGT